MPKLNLGCGNVKKEGFINTDWNADFEPDKVVDITKGLPFEDNFFDEVNADFVLNLVRDSQDFIFVMNEIWRVLKPGGELIILVPNALFPEDAFRDPMEARRFVPNTFDHFNYKHHRFKNLKYGFQPWEIVSVEAHHTVRLKAIMKPHK